MRVLPVKGYTQNQQKTFKGETKYLRLNHGTYYNTVEIGNNKPSYIDQDYFTKNDQSSKVRNRLYASVEKTLGTNHAGVTQEVYYADPKEHVPTSIKDRVDYVVYDNEPPYPKAEGQVSENYFGTVRHDYGKDFDEVREYYYRWEMAEAKKADSFRRNILADYDIENSKKGYDACKHNIDVAKYQQWQAQTCKDIYNEAGGLRYEKERAEDEISHINYQIAELNRKIDSEKRNISTAQTELNTKEKESALVELNLKDYKKAQKRNQKLDKINYDIKTAPSRDHSLTDLLEMTETLSAKLDKAKKDLRESIYNSKLFLAQAPSKLKELATKKAAKEAFIEETKGKLIPLFDKLKNFYNVQQIIKR